MPEQLGLGLFGQQAETTRDPYLGQRVRRADGTEGTVVYRGDGCYWGSDAGWLSHETRMDFLLCPAHQKVGTFANVQMILASGSRWLDVRRGEEVEVLEEQP